MSKGKLIINYLNEYKEEYKAGRFDLSFTDKIECQSNVLLKYEEFNEQEIFNITQFCTIYHLHWHVTNKHNEILVSIY